MTTMSFKTFTFPHNPERITVTTETRIATAHCPEYGPIHQNLGLARRIIQAEGVFYGANAKTQYTALEALFARYGIPYHIRRTEIGPVVFEYRQEKNPCSLCAKLRRGALHTAAQELGCNKVALGHHLDDAVETFYMNLWREGRIGCFSPVTELSDRGLTLIRPLLLATEQEVRCAVKEEGFPIVKSRCPADGVTTREDTKNFVRERCRTDRAFRQKTLHALQESGIDGWRPLHPARTSKKEDTAHADARI